MRYKPTKKKILKMLSDGYSATKIAKATGWNVGTILNLFDKYDIEKPSIGRQKGFEMSNEHKNKISKALIGKKNSNYGKHPSNKTRRRLSKSHQSCGLFGFIGGYYAMKKRNPWTKVWKAQISWKGKQKSLGVFHDPLSCQIVYDFVWHEIYNYI